jgi:phosphoglycerate dehydrogenase-like enzyme
MTASGSPRRAIVVSVAWEATWPLVAEALQATWSHTGPVVLVRVEAQSSATVGEVVRGAGFESSQVAHLASLGVPMVPGDLEYLPSLREVALSPRSGYGSGLTDDLNAVFASEGIRHHAHVAEGFWGQSVAEYALALTLCGLRRIPQLHQAMQFDARVWDYAPGGGDRAYTHRGAQFGDDDHFASGTVAGKRVRIVGAGNIASRYASFCEALGADVAAYDPYAPEPAFHRTGARREWHLDRLVVDAEIFAPLVPLMPATRGLVTAAHIDALPDGCLVIWATRAGVTDTATVRRRVLADEISLAADVFDVEPVPPGDPLLGRANVVHTPHNAGRTRHANVEWARQLAAQFADL